MFLFAGNYRHSFVQKLSNMNKNVGSFDRIFRVLVAIVFAILYYKNIVAGIPGIILMVLSVVFLITGLIGTCPIYLGLGWSTKSRENE